MPSCWGISTVVTNRKRIEGANDDEEREEDNEEEEKEEEEREEERGATHCE